MDREPVRPDHRLNVGGIKLSPPLVLLNYSRQLRQSCALLPALRRLSDQQINIFYLSRAIYSDRQTVTTSFCVQTEHHVNALASLQMTRSGTDVLASKGNIGALSIYPHRHDFSLLGKVLKVFSDFDLEIHGVCSSISALSILTDFNKFDHAVSALAHVLNLPDNHSPFRQEFRIRQINP